MKSRIGGPGAVLAGLILILAVACGSAARTSPADSESTVASASSPTPACSADVLDLVDGVADPLTIGGC